MIVKTLVKFRYFNVEPFTAFAKKKTFFKWKIILFRKFVTLQSGGLWENFEYKHYLCFLIWSIPTRKKNDLHGITTQDAWNQSNLVRREGESKVHREFDKTITNYMQKSIVVPEIYDNLFSGHKVCRPRL